MKQLILILSIGVFAFTACKGKQGAGGTFRMLEKKEAIQGTTFAAGTSVTMNEKGLLTNVILGEDQPLLDINCGAAFPYVFKKGTELLYRESIVFDKPEMPSFITLREKHTILGIEFPAGTTLEPAYMSGTVGGKKTCNVGLIQFQLGEAMVIKGRKFNANEYIQVYPNKKIVYRENGAEKTL